jgi:creatinine amidohydrolase
MHAPEAPVLLSAMSSRRFAEVAGVPPVILLPLGSHEDHGPNLLMGDYVLAEKLAERIARRATAQGTPTYVAPTLPFGVADYFGSSAGGLAISAASFRGVLQDLLGGLLRHGLERIVILNGHGGNVPVIHEVTLEVRMRRGVVVPSFYLWKVAREIMEARLGPGQGARFGHGGEPLASLTMALRPDEMPEAAQSPEVAGRFLDLPVSGFGTLAFEGVSIDAPVEFDQVPRAAGETALPLASAALGEAVADGLVETAARFVGHFASAASASGVSKSRKTDSSSTGTSATDSI